MADIVVAICAVITTLIVLYQKVYVPWRKERERKKRPFCLDDYILMS